MLLQSAALAGRGQYDRAVSTSAMLLLYDSAGRGGDPFARAALHMQRAEWLGQLGRRREAEREWLWHDNADVVDWPTGPAQAGDGGWALGAHARLRRGGGGTGGGGRRGHAGEGGVETEAGQVRLVAGAVELDTDRLDTLLAAKDYRSAVALVAGEFLEGFAVSGASAFEDRMTAERALWRGRSVDALLRRADELLGTGDLPGAHEMAQRALVLDPTSDVAVRAVMRCRALAGDRAGALECYETFAARLAGDADTEPGTDTKALAEP